jgi:hypothetical protein
MVTAYPSVAVLVVHPSVVESAQVMATITEAQYVVPKDFVFDFSFFSLCFYLIA